MRATPIVLASIVLGACVPTEFDEVRDGASIVSLAPPDDYPVRGFGRVVIGYGGELAGTYVSRVAASAGIASPFSVYPLLIGEELRLDVAVLDGCNDEMTCQRSAGISLAALPTWGPRSMCIAAATPEGGEVKIRCEDDPLQVETEVGPVNEGFGTSAVGLVGQPRARALFGAPDASGGRGAVYRLPDRAPPVAIDLSEGAGSAQGTGSAIAAANVDSDTFVLATAAPRGAIKRVIVATNDVADDGTITTRVRACLDSSAEGFGGALAFGDLNGDGLLDLAVGSAAGDTRLDNVQIYDGASLPPPGSCEGAWAPAVTLTCPEVDGVPCDAANLFGAALTIGDVDADGRGDLVVGAPNASVDRVARAGVAYVFRGAGSLGDLTSVVGVLRHSRPSDDTELGAALAVIPGALIDGTRRRDEIAVGAPGAHRVYVFLCSGIAGDAPGEQLTTRCQSR